MLHLAKLGTRLVDAAHEHVAKLDDVVQGGFLSCSLEAARCARETGCLAGREGTRAQRAHE
mgnify:CR=1 FL=1